MRICIFENATQNDGNCVYESKVLFSKEPSILNECDCPLECEFTGYSNTISTAEFPTKNYAEYLMN
jgi:hypothetical protein